MKNLFVFLCMAVSVYGCKKKDNRVPIDSQLKADYGYKTGSYWIYRDSLSGTIDSAYVESNTVAYSQAGCVKRAGAPELEHVTIYIKVANANTAVKESWTFYMNTNKLSMAYVYKNDTVQCNLNPVVLFTYPIQTGKVGDGNACTVSADSAGLLQVIPEVAMNGNSYSNAAKCPHSSTPSSTEPSYNYCFYLSPGQGMVKLVSDHPAVPVHRVLELVRCHIVK